jgi:hypothetical protein
MDTDKGALRVPRGGPTMTVRSGMSLDRLLFFYLS